MKFGGFHEWLRRRAANNSVRAIGIVDPGRVRAVIPSPAKQQDYGTVASWNKAVNKIHMEKIRAKMKRGV